MFTISGTQLKSSSPVRGKRREIRDVWTWVECFVQYMSAVTAYVPQWTLELLAYMSLILRTARLFLGRAWFQYDRALRQDAAISCSKDWHIMRADLYNYGEICRSWNRGKCSSKFPSCSYQHMYDIKGCGGGHRSIKCQHNYVNRTAEHWRARSPPHNRRDAPDSR